MKYQYHTIVIGAGSGGLVVASGVANFGAKVALIEKDKMGGECLNTGCVPSKAFLKSAHLMADIKNSNSFGLSAKSKTLTLRPVMQRVNNIIKKIAPHDSTKRYTKMGVNVIKGHASLWDNHTVKVKSQKYTAKNIVIATGSKPNIPNIKGIEKIPYYTNENIFTLKKLPKHLIVLGGGPIGMELGQGFCFLGSKVSIIDRNNHIFKKDDAEVSPIMEKKLKKDGINLLLSTQIQEIQKIGNTIIVKVIQQGKIKIIKGDTLLISLGRKPSSSGLNLENFPIKLNPRGYILTDKRQRTSIKNIYACGDVTGPYLFTHIASYQAGIIIRNIIFNMPAKTDYSLLPWTTYTKPEVAHIGYTENMAKKLGLFKEKVIFNLKEIDRSICENDTDGFLKFILNKKGKLIGATLVSEKAGEMIPLATLAIQKKLSPSVFANLIFSYPTEAEIFKFTAYEKMKQSLNPLVKKIIKFLFIH